MNVVTAELLAEIGALLLLLSALVKVWTPVLCSLVLDVVQR